MHRVQAYIGCAGWSVPPAHAAEFATIGSHLERYSARFRAVEINSSFYRPHRPATYARWAATVPEDFRFAVKVPKQITHVQRLCDVDVQVERFLNDVVALGPKLGPLLVQLPPSMAFDAAPVDAFFGLLRGWFSGDIVCEPRHRSWFSAEAEHLLAARQIGRVAADPALVPQASVPGGWQGIVYYRLHGSPRMYYSAYDIEYIEQLAQTLASEGPDVSVWCIFDNTAAGAATQDSLVLQQKLAIELTRTRQPQTPDEI
jgi:uncharacterized protein YecE (DUF72 family)